LKNKKGEARQALRPRKFRDQPLRPKQELVTAIAATGTAAAATEAATAFAAAAATEATATAAAATTEGTAGAFLLGTSFVNGESATTEVDAIELLSGHLGLFGRAESNERETAGAAGHFVHGDVNVSDVTELNESRAELVFGGFEGHVANVEFGTHGDDSSIPVRCQSVPDYRVSNHPGTNAPLTTHQFLSSNVSLTMKP
jgi:hypothetical protein